MQIPSETVIAALTIRGRLFRIEDGEFFDGDGSHKFVVCNRDGTDELILLALATSQYQKVYAEIEKMKLSIDTVVVVPRGESRHFPEITAFDCNELHRISKERMAVLHREGKLKVIDGIMKPEHMAQIEAAICASPQIEPEIQAMVGDA